MQKDFHHTVIYVLARLAGFDRRQSGTIAYSSQYVDDEVRSDVVYFTSGAIYEPICSSHKKLDGRNFSVLANHLSWVPFHFLPGDMMEQNPRLKNGTDTKEFEERVICLQDSVIANEMIKECFNLKDTPHFLHRIGVTLHVYADTWAHQGFSGIQSVYNKVQYLDDEDPRGSWIGKMLERVKDFFTGIASRLIGDVMPLGHGAALAYPDLPYLSWKYKDHQGHVHERNNVDEFMDAVDHIYAMLVKLKNGSFNHKAGSLSESDSLSIRNCFSDFTDEDADVRHTQWLGAISAGLFSFGREDISYVEFGKGSWTEEALGEELYCRHQRKYYAFKETFMTSDWKMFHDALKDHRYFLTRVLFPKYSLCLA